MSRLSILFEEDIEMQDALEDIDGMVDDSEDILINSIEDRYDDSDEIHLFDNEDDIDEDELTSEEEHQINVALLDDDIEDDIIDADMDDDIIDVALDCDD